MRQICSLEPEMAALVCRLTAKPSTDGYNDMAHRLGSTTGAAVCLLIANSLEIITSTCLLSGIQ